MFEKCFVKKFLRLDTFFANICDLVIQQIVQASKLKIGTNNRIQFYNNRIQKSKAKFKIFKLENFKK